MKKYNIFIAIFFISSSYFAFGGNYSDNKEDVLGFANSFAVSINYGSPEFIKGSKQLCNYGFLLNQDVNNFILKNSNGSDSLMMNSFSYVSDFDNLKLILLIKMKFSSKSTLSDSEKLLFAPFYRPVGNIIFYPNFYSIRVGESVSFFCDKQKIYHNILFKTDLSKDGSILVHRFESNMLSLFAWEPYGRYWELKAKDFEALKKMNELKISAFEKLLKKTENDPQFAKLYLENRPDSYNPERRIIKRKPEALEKAWQKFSARWEKENPKLVPKFKIIPLLPESDSQMKK